MPESLGKLIDATQTAFGNEVPAKGDALGRSLSNDYYLRGILNTAAATLTRAQETLVMSGLAANFLDLVSITGANTSTAAISVQIRSGTGGAVIDTISIPAAGANGATSTVVKTYWPALPMSEKAQSWTAQLTNSGEISDSPVTINIITIQNPNGV